MPKAVIPVQGYTLQPLSSAMGVFKMYADGPVSSGGQQCQVTAIFLKNWLLCTPTKQPAIQDMSTFLSRITALCVMVNSEKSLIYCKC